LLTLILSSGVCLADNYVGGIPLTSVQSGTVDGGIYCDSYYGTGTQAIHDAKTIDKTFTLPANADVEWAMLLTTVYCGHMQNNYQGTAKVSFNGQTLGTETLNVPFTYITNGGNDGKAYAQVNNHVNRVTSDYMMYYDVTDLVKAGENKATVKTEPTDDKFDGRVKLITLVVAYNDGSGNKIWYQVNRGHDVDTYYSDEDLEENYVGSTSFNAALPAGASLADADLTLVHMASEDGTYTFNGKTLASGTPQGTYCGSNTWDVKDSFKSSGANTLTYDRSGGFYKNAFGILTAEYSTSSSDDTTDDTPGNTTDNTSGNTTDNTSGNTTDNTSGNTTDNTSGNTTDNTSGNTTDNTSGNTTDNTAGNTTDNTSGNTTDNTSNTTGETSSADLGIQAIKVSHNDATKAWDNLNNTVNVTVINNGPEDAGSFALGLYSEGTIIESKPISGLANGASETFKFTWKPEEVKNYTLKAVVVPGSTISDTNATNNELSKVQPVMHNGYAGDNPLETYAHGIVQGDVIYDYGNSTYSNKITSGGTYSVSHSLDLPDGATVKLARLYNFWTWSATGTTGVTPSMSLQFDGNSLTPEAEYSDQKGWGSQYDYPTGTWAYNVTGLVSENGTYTTTVTNTNSDSSNYFCVDGIALLVVYEDPSGKEIEYWINEGCDMVSTMSTSGGLTPEEATVEIPFEEGSINLSNVEGARLWTTVQSGGHSGISLEFNEMNASGVYDSTPYSDLDIDEARSVGTYLLSGNNRARIVPPLVTDNSGDYLAPSGAVLVVSYKGEVSAAPALSLSASPLNLTAGKETNVTYTVTSSGTPVEGALVNLSGCATGSGTTDASGIAVLAVNASCEGTITATASKEGYTGADLIQQAVSETGTPVTPALFLSASTLDLPAGIETEVTYIVTSSGTPVEGALVNLSGCATGSGTTDASGKAVLAVNASCEGTITATASKEGYTGADLTQQAKTASSSPSGSNSSAEVSLNVTIIPAICLTVSPDSVDFGTVTPGTPSQSVSLTLKNSGGTGIKVTADVNDQENGPFVTGLLLDQNIWSSYSKTIAADSSETSEVQLDLPLNYSSSGQFQGSLIFWAEAA